MAAVIQGMNHLDSHGTKLRVEYKKMLPQAERDLFEDSGTRNVNVVDRNGREKTAPGKPKPMVS